MPSHAFELIDGKLDVDLAEFIAEQREAKVSFDRIALVLSMRTNTVVNGETIRRWHAEQQAAA
jgi:hypothetical protein